MSVRSTIWLGLVMSLAACNGPISDPTVGVALGTPERETVSAYLEIRGDEEVTAVATRELTLRVRCVDLDQRPLAGKEVLFGLAGSAEGASLENAAVLTDASGHAETVLKVGGTGSQFQVRASTEGAAPKYFDVRVVEAARPGLRLGVSYSGNRAIVSRRISVIDNMSCDKLQNNSADLFKYSYVLREANQRVSYQEPLGAGRSYAAVAWGSDDTNSTLAKGCKEFTLPVSDNAEEAQLEVIIQLENLPLALMAQYDVTLDLDVGQPLAGLAARSRACVSDALPKTATPEASFFLDLLAAKLDFSDARAKYDLDLGLQAALTAAQTGPLAYFTALSTTVAEEGAAISVDALLTSPQERSASRFEVTSIVAIRGGKSARPVDFTLARGTPEMVANYDSDRAALDVNSLKVQLGFGSYAISLLEAVHATPDARGQMLSALDGCLQLERFVSDSAAYFPGLAAQDAKALCTQGVQTLMSRVTTDWTSLDQERGLFQLNGAVYVHDRDGDGQVDDLGPSPLTGAWSAGQGSAETALKATLRVTPRATLTI